MAALYDGKEYLVERFNHVVFTRVDKDRLTHRLIQNGQATASLRRKLGMLRLAGNRLSSENGFWKR